MSTTTHRHRPHGEERVRPWSHCVVGPSAAPCSGVAHGNVTYVATCRCGATRAAESNAGVTRYGRWQIDAAAQDDDA